MKKQNDKGNIVTILLVTLGLFTFFVGAFVFGYWFWGRSLVHFPAYSVATTYIAHHPQVAELLGMIKEWDPSPSGEFDYDKERGDGELTLKLVGDKTKGKIHFKFLTEYGQPWIIQKAFLQTDKEKEPIVLDTPQTWLDAADDLLNQRNPDEAQKICVLMQQAVPDDYRGTYCLGEVALFTGDTNRYLELRQSLVAKSPNYYRFQSGLAYAYYVTGNLEKSIEHYTQSWELMTDPETATEIARAHLNIHQEDAAFKWLEKSRKAADGINMVSLAYQYGRFYYHKKNYDEAIASFTLAKKLDPNDSFPYFGLALSYEALAQVDRAIYYYEQGIARNPTGAFIFRQSLVTLLTSHQYDDEAIYHLIKTILYHPKIVGPYLQLAELYGKEGRTKEADAVYVAVSKIDPKAVQNPPEPAPESN